MLAIGYEDVLGALLSEAAEKPDYIDPRAQNVSCAYVDPETGCPSCIVGRALARLGVPVELLRSLDSAGSGGGSITALEITPHLFALGYDVYDDAAVLLNAVQGHQDAGTPWLAAVGLSLGELVAGLIDEDDYIMEMG